MTAPNSSNPKASQRERYLNRMLSQNPMWHAPEIMALRRKALGLQPKKDDAQFSELELIQIRHRAKEATKKIQAEFWSLPLEDLQRRVSRLPVKQVPELAAIAKRLHTVASCRDQFPKLIQAKSMDMDLFNAFKSAVVMPPAEAGFAKEKFIQRLKFRDQVNSARAAISHIEERHPELYHLERDWFQTIDQLKRPRAGSQFLHGVIEAIDVPEMGWTGWIFAMIALRVALRLLVGWGQ